jgi:acetamidase/formamidase
LLAMARTHHFPTDQVHFDWSSDRPPVLSIEPGDTVIVETREVSDGQIVPTSETAVLAGLDMTRLYPLAGPIAVAGAQPGDTLAIEILDVQTRGWGWAALLPGLGLLPDDFPDPHLQIFDLSNGVTASLTDAVSIPLEPFLGTMGVCPAGASGVSIMPPGIFGGNMDTRQLVRGTTLYLPVQVDGALFSTGDGHGAQGDGEVCVTGIEAPLYAALRFGLEKGRAIPAPQYRTRPGSLTARVDGGAFYATTGVNGDLFAAAQDAVRAMIEHLGRDHGLEPQDAYVLCSLAADLKISEIVDAGQYVVSAALPDAVFT